MMSGYDCLNKKRFNSQRKVDSELAATISVGSVFQMFGAATAKARLPTVDSLTGGTMRWLALVERSVCRPRKSSTRSADRGNVLHCHVEPCMPEQPACTEFFQNPQPMQTDESIRYEQILRQ